MAQAILATRTLIEQRCAQLQLASCNALLFSTADAEPVIVPVAMEDPVYYGEKVLDNIEIMPWVALSLADEASIRVRKMYEFTVELASPKEGEGLILFYTPQETDLKLTPGWRADRNWALGALRADLRGWEGNVLVVKYRKEGDKPLLDVAPDDVAHISAETVEAISKLSN